MTDTSARLRAALRRQLGDLDAELAHADSTAPKIRGAAQRAEARASARLDHLAQGARFGDHENAGMVDEAVARASERRAAQLVALHGPAKRGE